MRDPLKGIDQVIQEAQEAGKFDDLQGKGKPLALDMSPDAVVNGLLKEANVKPEWIELASEIERLTEERDQLLERFAADLETERATLQHNQAPVPAAAPRAQEPCDSSARHEDARTAPRWRFGWPFLAARGPRPSPRMPAPEAGQEEGLAAFQRRWDATLARYASLLHQINRKQRRFNQVVPLTDRQRPPVSVAERLEAIVERFPCLARAGDGSLRPVRGSIPPSLLAPPPEEAEGAFAKRDLRRAAAIHGMRQVGRRPPPIG